MLVTLSVIIIIIIITRSEKEFFVDVYFLIVQKPSISSVLLRRIGKEFKR